MAVDARYRLYITSRGHNRANYACSGTYLFTPNLTNAWELSTHSYTWASSNDDDSYRFLNQGTQVYQDNVVRPTSWGDWISSEICVTGNTIAAYRNDIAVYNGSFASFSAAPYKIPGSGHGPA